MDARSRLITRAGVRTRVLVLTLLATLLLTACSGGDDDMGSDDDSMPVAPPTTAAGAMAAADSVDDADREESTSGGATSESDARQQRAGWQQRIIRTANVTLKVNDDNGVGSALESVRLMATAKGGYVFSSNSYVEDDRQFAQITIQIPVEQFDTTMNDLRSAPFVEDVVREESSSQDVSEEYVDNESRLNALQETERRFLALLAEAESIEDILRLEQELTDLRSQIETILGRQNYLDQVTSYSTITVSLQPSGTAVEPQIADGDGFSLTGILDRAWDHSRGAIEVILVVTITLAIVGVAVLPFAIVGWFGYRIFRTRFRNATS